ncbi:kinase-like domain-containing protein [Lactifluus volemus]|nr:kinase-like domain-containing protein [Lactifluus volemus]
MITVDSSTLSPELPTHKPSLADLSRNASVISSSSSSSSTTDLVPIRPRPVRTFSSPRSRSPGGPPTPKASRPPAYITRELGIADQSPESIWGRSRANSKSKSRSSSANGRLSADDFEFGDILGEGSYSTVIHGTHNATRQEYAIKVLDKGHLKRNNKLHTALAEKNTLVRLGSGHPGIVRLHWAFQDDWSLYFVLDLASNGELQSRISRMGSLSTTCARYYTAQLVDALDYMHQRGVIHRDLKPENLLLDDDFRIKVTDFGTGKLIDVPPERATKTFVGTAQYVSPELLEANETSKSSDLWALGCVLYQMIAGRFAFQGLSEYLTWQKIKHLDYTFPEGFDPEAADLVRRLLVRDPLERMGAGPSDSAFSMEALRAHPFFASIHWDTLWDDPAPPLETGLVRREAAPVDEWDDVGATWDELVSGPDGSEAEDEEVGAWRNYIRIHTVMSTDMCAYGRQETMGSNGRLTRRHSCRRRLYHPKRSVRMARFRIMRPRLSIGRRVDAAEDASGSRDRWCSEVPGTSAPLPIPRNVIRESYATSSSDGSPVEKLGAALEAIGIHRGRLRTRSPTPARGAQGSVESPDWYATSLFLELLTYRSTSFF